MKKIISATFFIAISIFATGLFAQEMSANQLKNFQTDNIENFKKAFTEDDLTKCFQIKDTSYNLLSLSALHNRHNVFNYLVSNKIDANKSCSSTTPLMYAAKHGHLDIIKGLLKYGAKKEIKDNNGKTAKDYALENKQSAAALIL